MFISYSMPIIIPAPIQNTKKKHAHILPCILYEKFAEEEGCCLTSTHILYH